MGDLTEKLRAFSTPLEIEIIDGCLTASDYEFTGRHDISCVFNHPEGTIELSYDMPSIADHYDLPTNVEDLGVQELLLLVEDRTGLSWRELPWAEDYEPAEAQNDEIKNEYTEWVSERICLDDIPPEFIGRFSEHAPGFEIFDFLGDGHREQFGLRIVDIGDGPENECWAVEFSGNADTFNSLLESKHIPYRLKI